MRATAKKVGGVVGAILTVAILTLAAGAQCGNQGRPEKATVKPQAWQQGGNFGEPRLQLVSDSNDPIVGLWRFTFMAGDNLIDHGFITWHADGTELMNSSRPPESGSFCMGVWQLKGVHYKVNHYAIGWDPTGSNLIGLVNIREDVVLNEAGTAYNGTFTLTQYDTDGNVIASVPGVVHADRIGVNSNIKTF